MILRDYLSILRKYLWLIVLGGVIGLAAGAGASWYLGWIPLYSAKATVLIGGDVAAVEDNSAYTRLGDQFLETYADIATRTITLQRVIDRLGLDTSTDDLEKFVSAQIVEATQLLDINVSHANPEVAAAIANAIADEIIQMPSLRVRNFVVMVEPAQPPDKVEKVWLLIVLVAGTLGVLVMGGAAFIIEFFRDPVYSGKEVTRRAHVPVLATVRPLPNGRFRLRQRESNWYDVNKTVWWPLVQLCRHQLQSDNGQSAKPARILVTSPTDGRAKSIIAANLAAAWASDDQKVLLIDADRHEPLLDSWFGVNAEPGLTDLMTGSSNDAQIMQALRETDIPNLALLPAGKIDEAQNNGLPMSGLAATRLKALLDKLSTKADVVILVGSPLLTTGDGIVAASQAEGILLALRTGDTTMSAVNDARDALEMMDSELYGAILTEVG